MARLRLAAVTFLLAWVALVAWTRRPQPEPEVDEAAVATVSLGRGTHDLAGRAAEISIVLVSLDTLRPDHAGLHGHPGGLTPNLDAFAARSVVFHDATTPAPWTLPAHMSLWTGLWPSRHGLTNKLRSTGEGTFEDALLAPELPTFPEALAAAGYATAAFTGGSGVLGGYGFARGFGVYEETGPFGGLGPSVAPALAWLEAQGDARTFLFLHGYDAHGQRPLPADALAAPPESSQTTPESLERLRETQLEALGAGEPVPPLPAGVLGVLGPHYAARVREADRHLGTFLDGLEALGLADRTLILIVSDHGEELGEHGGVDHGHTLFQEQVRALMIARWPGQDQREDVSQPVRTFDLVPTAFDALGLPPWGALDATSLLPLLDGEELALPVFSETDLRGFVHLRMGRQGSLKLVLDLESGTSALYDLAGDPGEHRDLAAEDPAATYELEQAVKGWVLGSR